MTEFNNPEKDYEDPQVFLSEFRTYIESLVSRNIELIEERDPEEAAAAYRECVRDVVHGFYDAGLIKGDNPDDVMTVAAQASYICRMFLVAFDKAYVNTSARISNVKSLEDQFKL